MRITVKMDLIDIGWEGNCRLDSSRPGRGKQANKLRVYIKFREFLA